MPDAPTFNRDTGEQCQCLSQSKTGWGVQSLLLLIGLSVLAGTGYLLWSLTTPQSAALPPTAPVARTSSARPSPATTTPEPTSTPDPFASTVTPAIQLVMEVTRTPVPTATLTPPEATLRAGQATATAMAMPITCERTTVTPGERKTCFWEVVLPSPTPMPTYPPCETPVPGMRCQKEG